MVKKKISKTLAATTAAATFGAAMTSMYVAPDIQADIVTLTYNGGNSTATNPWLSFSGLPVDFEIDQIPNVGGQGGDFAGWNDTFNVTGRTHAISGSAVIGNIVSWYANGVASGDIIDPATFAGTAAGIGGGSTGTGAGTFDGSGTAFIAFRTAASNVGWFKLSYTVQGPIIYSDGELGTMGEAVTVGGTGGGCNFAVGDVNMDGAVDLLDVAPFVALLTGGGFQCEADINKDGAVDLLDVTPFVDLLTGG